MFVGCLSGTTLFDSLGDYLVFRHCWVLSLSELDGPLDEVIVLLLVLLSLFLLLGDFFEHLGVLLGLKSFLLLFFNLFGLQGEGQSLRHGVLVLFFVLKLLHLDGIGNSTHLFGGHYWRGAWSGDWGGWLT